MNDTSAGLQENLVPAMNTLPAAARALVNVNGLCRSRCSEEQQSTRCSLFYFLLSFLAGQSPFVLFCTGYWGRSSLNLFSYIKVMRLVRLVDNSIGCGVFLFIPFVD